MLVQGGSSEWDFIVVLEGINPSHPSDDLGAIMKRVDAACRGASRA